MQASVDVDSLTVIGFMKKGTRILIVLEPPDQTNKCMNWSNTNFERKRNDFFTINFNISFGCSKKRVTRTN